jgi:hypothetical protein
MKYFQEAIKLEKKRKGCIIINIARISLMSSYHIVFRNENCRWAAEAPPGYRVSLKCDYVFLFPVNTFKDE